MTEKAKMLRSPEWAEVAIFFCYEWSEIKELTG